MVTKYKIVNWRFNTEAWANAMSVALDTFGEDFPVMLGVTMSCVRQWSKGVYKEGFEHPSMSNVIKTCNLLDLDPRKFFELEGE